MPRTATKKKKKANGKQKPTLKQQLMIIVSSPPAGQWTRSTWKTYLQDHRELLDTIFTEAKRKGFANDAELAEACGLTETTVYRLREGLSTRTQRPTLWKLAEGVGLEMVMRRKQQASRRSA